MLGLRIGDNSTCSTLLDGSLIHPGHTATIDVPCLTVPQVLERLCGYAWPGNIRQLQNAIEYAVILADAAGIGIKHLPPELQSPPELHEALAQTDAGLRLEDREHDSPGSWHWHLLAERL